MGGLSVWNSLLTCESSYTPTKEACQVPNVIQGED
jgi:hypothetical protein